MKINLQKIDKKMDAIFNKDTSIWHTWFAWYPVKIGHFLVLFENVERRIEFWMCYTSGGWNRYYRFIENDEKTNERIKNKLIATTVKKLKNYGYPFCNKDNILTDSVYSWCFLSILKENKGRSKELDKIIDELMIICRNCNLKNGTPYSNKSERKEIQKEYEKSKKKWKNSIKNKP